MPITISYKTINSDSFNRSLRKLGSVSFDDVKTTWNITRMLKQFEKELTLARETYAKWSSDYFSKDEGGKFMLSKTPNPLTPYEIIEGKQDEFVKKMDDFLEMKTEIQSYPLKIEDLECAKLTPHDLVALEPILDQTSFAMLESAQPETPSQV